ncbi:rod shape-determining protein MreC [Ornithinibacillus sp. BX22]|uniref:Cell shape-determining protein MreC n=2 Tax=Ornithinibacillus TaxID=484508 RepID=A0A923RJQ0_9BACI|nr:MULTISPECIES: rod shape-determining protein MreC [Ornithinibacillus]MBC5637583.1 rod shape-determining protein MreC [Ornithinibacillus hominis]MBS3679450.1 rod shape-determining protein MreC [Ornithinibacillus massiliensis]
MSFFRKKRLFIILIGIIVLVALVGFSIRDRVNLTTAEQFVSDVIGVAQNVISTPVKYVAGIFENIDDIRNTYEENQILRERLAQYKGLIYEVQEIKDENEELRALLDKEDSIRSYNPIHATVTARSPERWIEQLTINKGKSDGVKVNMAVITAEGMIGKVQSVAPATSTVQLLTGFDEFNRISATVSREGGKGIFGLIESYDKETNSLLFKIIEDSDQDIEEGELVVSSGMGGVFPAGLPIGTVKEVVPDQYGLTRTALVEPAANMYEINHVVVVERLLGQDDEDEAEGEEE